MAQDVEDVIAGLDPAERRKVEAMAAELIAEEMTLRELRKARADPGQRRARTRYRPGRHLPAGEA